MQRTLALMDLKKQLADAARQATDLGELGLTKRLIETMNEIDALVEQRRRELGIEGDRGPASTPSNGVNDGG